MMLPMNRIRVVGVALIGTSVLLGGAACSSKPSVDEGRARELCHEAVSEKYDPKQRPPVYDSESATAVEKEWKISGMSRGTHPVGEGEAPTTEDGKRSSKDMAHMKFECTVKDESATLDTWRLASQDDILAAEKASKAAGPTK